MCAFVWVRVNASKSNVNKQKWRSKNKKINKAAAPNWINHIPHALQPAKKKVRGHEVIAVCSLFFALLIVCCLSWSVHSCKLVFSILLGCGLGEMKNKIKQSILSEFRVGGVAKHHNMLKFNVEKPLGILRKYLSDNKLTCFTQKGRCIIQKNYSELQFFLQFTAEWRHLHIAIVLCRKIPRLFCENL